MPPELLIARPASTAGRIEPSTPVATPAGPESGELPTMEELDLLVGELDRIDATLADLG